MTYGKTYKRGFVASAALAAALLAWGVGGTEGEATTQRRRGAEAGRAARG